MWGRNWSDSATRPALCTFYFSPAASASTSIGCLTSTFIFAAIWIFKLTSLLLACKFEFRMLALLSQLDASTASQSLVLKCPHKPLTRLKTSELRSHFHLYSNPVHRSLKVSLLTEFVLNSRSGYSKTQTSRKFDCQLPARFHNFWWSVQVKAHVL